MIKQTKAYTNYLNTLKTWGKLSNEYKVVRLEAKTNGWSNDIDRRLGLIEKKMDKLRGPLMTAVNKFAMQLATIDN